MSTDEKDDGIFLDLNFAPSWARSSPDANIQRLQSSSRFDRSDEEDSPRYGRDRKGGGADRRQRRDFDDRSPRNNSDRPPRRDNNDRKGPRSDMRRPESRGAVVNFGQPPRSGAGPRPQYRDDNRDDRRSFNDGGYRSRDREAYQPQQPALPLEIRVLPEQKALGAVIRRIQTSHRAFPLRDIAWLFLDNPNSCLIRIEPLKDQPLPLFQCKVCGYPALTEEEVRGHLINRHLEDFFDCEDVDCDPPTGEFNCVARCTLSGELLGPPNHHSFSVKVQEMLRTRYPNMSDEAYRSRIEMVRESEVIEQWRQQCTKKKVYRRKGATSQEEELPPAQDPTAEGGAETPPEAAAEPAPKAPSFAREVAELVFLREVVPEQLASVKHLICTAGVATQTSSRPLAMMLRDALTRERRFPASLFFALRGAFRHRKLCLFRANEPKGIDFAMLKTPTVLDTTHTVKILQDILTHVETNSACTKADLVSALGGTEEEKRKEVLIQLAWLVERGHIIEFYNDVLSVPSEYPAFKFLPGEKGYHPGQRHNAPASDAAPASTEAPAAEEVAAAPEAEPVTSQAEEPVTPQEAPTPPAEEQPMPPPAEEATAEEPAADTEEAPPPPPAAE